MSSFREEIDLAREIASALLVQTSRRADTYWSNWKFRMMEDAVFASKRLIESPSKSCGGTWRFYPKVEILSLDFIYNNSLFPAFRKQNYVIKNTRISNNSAIKQDVENIYTVLFLFQTSLLMNQNECQFIAPLNT